MFQKHFSEVPYISCIYIYIHLFIVVIHADSHGDTHVYDFGAKQKSRTSNSILVFPHFATDEQRRMTDSDDGRRQRTSTTDD